LVHLDTSGFQRQSRGSMMHRSWSRGGIEEAAGAIGATTDR